MTSDNKLTNLKKLHNDFYFAKKLVYDKCNLIFTEIETEEESKDYGAFSGKLNEMIIKFRVSKITPSKTGQFVTIWKRNKDGVTQPFDITDKIDFIIISSRNENNFGQFIFPKSVLLENGIISGNNKQGKRGIRVYPPWDKATSKQAEKTQSWQTTYFLKIPNKKAIETGIVKKLFNAV